MSVWKSRTIAVAVGATLVVGLGASGSVAAGLITSKDIKNNTITSKDIKNGAIKAKDVKDGSLEVADLAPTAKAALTTGVGGVQVATLAADTTIAKIGGPINDNNTNLNTGLTLPAGKYVVTVDGAFESAVASSSAADVFPQLSLWLDKNGDNKFRWQDGEGDISPNALMPTAKNLHISVSGTTVLTLTQPTRVGLLAFGYASDQSEARSGEIKVIDATLTATPLS
ncbi:hypothetical protein [Nocardioides sp. L-11A]|uniref:hypothetical protein n=1 Tax=Nocardioides sp. L-11A TaxID=3043848 RepID=UPI00249C6931|nr:hypothetical protein QJ852_11915 [Nocardioides sp. L-11A]